MQQHQPYHQKRPGLIQQVAQDMKYSSSSVCSLEKNDSLNVRIRTTREQDLGAIAEILSLASFESKNALTTDLAKQIGHENSPLASLYPTHISWKEKMEILRVKSALKAILRIRLGACQQYQTAIKTIQHRHSNNNEYNQNDATIIKQLWNQDTLVKALERTAMCSVNEPHVWRDHDFLHCPPQSSWLQHSMMTASTPDGTIVGFCEVAMMTKKQQISLSDDSTTEAPFQAVAIPTIVNLVTSPLYRRRGIGRALVKSAIRLVRQRQWQSGDGTIALYVHRDNTPAISLYNQFDMRIQTQEKKTRPTTTSQDNDNIFRSSRSEPRADWTTEDYLYYSLETITKETKSKQRATGAATRTDAPFRRTSSSIQF